MNDQTDVKRCTKCDAEYPATPEYFSRKAKSKSGLQAECKRCKAERMREYKRVNAEKISERKREYRQENAEKIHERNRKYNQANVEKIRERSRKWQQANPEKRRVTGQRREARKRALPDTLTNEQWSYAVDYFHGCCAVCGRQTPDLLNTHTLAIDHWIPLNSPDCTGTIATNIIPLCHGIEGCNNRKSDKPAEQWLTETYGKRKAKQILTRIEAYFDSLLNDRMR